MPGTTFFLILVQSAIISLALLAASGAAWAQEPLAIVATTADLKSLAEAVGGKRVSVVAIVPPNTDAEEYQPRPHDLNRLKYAQLILRVGVDYDLWLDRLIRQSGNPALARGGPGYVDCSFGIALLDVRGTQVGPSGGHAHGSGNPHYWLDPDNAVTITASIVEALARIDPGNAKYFEGERNKFLDRLAQAVRTWEQKLAAVRGKPIIAYHNNWAYYARRFRLNIPAYLEPRPGVPPSPAHLAALIALAKSQRVRIIVRSPIESAKNAELLADRTGATVVVLAGSVGALPQTSDFFSLFDYNAEALAAAYR